MHSLTRIDRWGNLAVNVYPLLYREHKIIWALAEERAGCPGTICHPRGEGEESAGELGLGAADATTKTRRGEQGRASHRVPHCPATRRDVPSCQHTLLGLCSCKFYCFDNVALKYGYFMLADLLI